MAEKIGADTSYICVKALEKGVNIIGVTRGEVTKIHHTEKLDQGEVLIAQFTENTSAMKIRGKAEVYTQFGMIRAGEVDDRSSAAPQGRPGAGAEIIRRGGVAHVQIKVGVRVDKAGEQQHPGHIHHLRTDGRNVAADVQYLLALHQNIRPAGPLAGDNGTALEQQSHHKTSSFE